MYPPGLPMTMAVALVVGGEPAIYVVAPILGALTVWLTYLLGIEVTDRRVACLAAVLFASSPLLLYMAFVPMSDVPAAAWWLLALTLAVGSSMTSGAAAGLASSLAILTRPNLAPVAVAMAIAIWRRSGMRRTLAFAGGLVPGCAAVGVIFQHLYGSPLRSGFADAGTLFHLRYVAQNARQFFRWLIELHSPLILLAALAPFARQMKHGGTMAAFGASLLACYAFYNPWGDWTFLRYLLPLLPLLFLFASGVVVSAIERLPAASRGGVALAVCALGVFGLVATAGRLGAFELRRTEHRYVIVADAVRRATPDNAAVISMTHSGNVRLYGGRTTLQWGYIEPYRLDATIDVLRAHGYEPFILLEGREDQQFRERFGGDAIVGRLDWPPRVEFIGHVQVRLYAPADRERYLRGEPLRPQLIPG
jgi:4-amino-4-deoxy-L-arabinose transferase-like glycosyltransferase